jgi:hypothetical protein
MSEAAVMRACQIGARGWDHAGWMGGFYPDDLPHDWRLGYYANEFSLVLVPAEQWCVASSSELEDWAEAVPGAFGFYLEMAAQADVYLPALKRAAEVLAVQLRGVVFDALPVGDDAARLQQMLGAERIYVDALRPGSRLEHPLRPDQALIGSIPEAERPDLIQLRHQIAQLAALSDADMALFFQGSPPDMALMRQAILLSQIMGYA